MLTINQSYSRSIYLVSSKKEESNCNPVIKIKENQWGQCLRRVINQRKVNYLSKESHNSTFGHRIPMRVNRSGRRNSRTWQWI